jgi:hypothetical protein
MNHIDNIDQFLTRLLHQLAPMFSPDTQLLLKKIPKNNGIILDALLIRQPDVNISPTIYLQDYYQLYQDGTTFDDICRIIYDVYTEVRLNHPIDPSFFTDFEQVKEHLIFQLLNYEKNRTRLPELPHIPYLDLVIVFCCLIQLDNGESATILIKHDHLKLWNTDLETIKKQAFYNTPRLLPAYIQPISAAIEEILEKNESLRQFLPHCAEDIPPLYVLTNETQCSGAACILYPDLLAEFADSVNQDLYILPSSIHEVMLLPATQRSVDKPLSELIQSINSDQLPLTQQLSDHVYFYSRAEKCLLQ